MGNSISACVDCGKSSATTDTPSGGKNKKSILSLKTPEMRAKGIIETNYSELPQIVHEK